MLANILNKIRSNIKDIKSEERSLYNDMFKMTIKNLNEPVTKDMLGELLNEFTRNWTPQDRKLLRDMLKIAIKNTRKFDTTLWEDKKDYLFQFIASGDVKLVEFCFVQGATFRLSSTERYSRSRICS